MAPVAGKVVFDGEPLNFGSVVFQHLEGGQPARGDIQPDGTFTLATMYPGDGARVGTHRVRVLCYKAQDPKLSNSKPMGDSLGPSLIPMRYTRSATSGLTVEVSPEGNETVLLELSSGKPKRAR